MVGLKEIQKMTRRQFGNLVGGVCAGLVMAIVLTGCDKAHPERDKDDITHTQNQWDILDKARQSAYESMHRMYG